MRRTRQLTKASEEQQETNGKPSSALTAKRRKVLAGSETSVDKLDGGSSFESTSEELTSSQPKGARKTSSSGGKSSGKSVAVSEPDQDYMASSSEASEGDDESESEQYSSESDFAPKTRKRNVKARATSSHSRLSLAGAKILHASTTTLNETTRHTSASINIKSEKVKKFKNPDSSSESSSDEFVRVKHSDSLPVDIQQVDPTSIKTEDPFAAIEKSIFAGVSTLSGSESESEAEYTEVNWPSLPGMSQPESFNLKEDSETVSKKPSRSKGKGRKGKVESKIDPKTMDISQLLKLGEGLGSENLDIPKFVPSEDDLTDLEEVSLDESEFKEEKPKYMIPKEGVEIILDVPEVNEKRKKKDFDVQAFLLRRLNNRKRSIQVLIHKVHLLGCISHGRYVNSVLNSEDLMGISLSLIPSQQCYPPKHADLAYLEKFLLWFNKTISLKDPKCISKYPSNLLQSLLKQFGSRVANSKRDLVFMFISVLRSLGIKTRLIMSLQPAPLKLASTDLCATLSKKAVDSLNYYVDKHNAEKKKSKKSKRRREVKHEVPKLLQKKASNTRKKNENKSKYFAKKLRKPADEKEIGSIQNSSQEENTSKYFKSEKMSVSPAGRGQRRKGPSGGAGTSKQTEEKNSVAAQKKSPTVKSMSKAVEPQPSSRKPLPRRQAKKIAKHSSTEDSDSASEPVKKQPKRDVPKKKVASKKLSAKKTTGKKGSKKVATDSESDSDFEPVAVKHEVDSSDSQSSSEESEDFEVKVNIPRKRQKEWSVSDPVDRRVLSSDSSDGLQESNKRSKKKTKSDDKVPKKAEKKLGVDVWVEVFLEAEEKWFSVDVPQKSIHCSSELHSKATQPVLYVVGFSPDLSIKDVTRRYVMNWTTIKQRVDEVWWERTLKRFRGPRNIQDREEDEELSDQMLNHPLPTVIGEYKNHPLYALQRHLLKFEAIYPPDAPTLGFVRGEAVYARENVACLHSREVWVKEAKVVCAGEQAYKVVKARPKYNRATGTCITDIPLDLFGAWQVGEYVPPVAEDGKVPRNEYGNVELFKPCMLPKGTVHLPIAGLSRVAKKLGIDCAPAMIGFDFHSGGSHPTFDGYVVCQEFKDTLLDAWTQEVEMAAKRAAEKKEKRVYDNWKRLIKGLLIRERLKDRYAFGEEAEVRAPKPSTSKETHSKTKSSKPVFKKIPASSRAKRKD